MKKWRGMYVAALLLTASVGRGEEKGQVGRYQLINGEYTIVTNDPNSNGQIKGLFKIDTATGRVWEWIHVAAKDGVYEKKWNEMKDGRYVGTLKSE